MEIKEAIQIHGADAVFTASAAGECEDYEPLRAMGLHVDTINAAEQIGDAVYDSMTTEERTLLHWEAARICTSQQQECLKACRSVERSK